MNQKTWNRIFDIELIVGILASVILGIMSGQISQISWPRLSWLTLILLVIILGLRIWGRKDHNALAVSKWLSSITLVIVFYFLIYTAVSVLNILIEPLSTVWSVLGLLLMLVVGVPIVVANFSIVKNWFMRLFIGFTFYLNYMYNVNRFWGAPDWVKQILSSGLIAGLAVFILTFFVFRAWNLKFNWNLKFIKTKNFQILALIGLVLVSVWFIFFNTFIQLVSSWTELLCFWQWDFSNFEVTSKTIMIGATAGIMEETIRYLNLAVLLYAMRNLKNRVVFSVFITAIMFGLSHLGNLSSSHFGIKYSLEVTLQQVVYTFGAGMLLAVIYLYTGKLWLNMMIHGLLDMLVLSETPLAQSANPLIPYAWLSITIITLIPLVIALVMLTGKRRKFMEDNADRIIATT